MTSWHQYQECCEGVFLNSKLQFVFFFAIELQTVLCPKQWMHNLCRHQQLLCNYIKWKGLIAQTAQTAWSNNSQGTSDLSCVFLLSPLCLNNTSVVIKLWAKAKHLFPLISLFVSVKLNLYFPFNHDAVCVPASSRLEAFTQRRLVRQLFQFAWLLSLITLIINRCHLESCGWWTPSM